MIRGLDCGGDDYITKPFKLGSSAPASGRFCAALTGEMPGIIFCGRESWWSAWQKEKYSQRENRWSLPDQNTGFCVSLLQNSGRVLPRDLILNRLWDGCGNFVDDNTLSVYIRRLREKLEKDPSRPEHLKTVRGLGYRWEE